MKTLEKETYHLMDDKQRIGSIEHGKKSPMFSILVTNTASRYNYSDHLNSSAVEADETGNIISLEEYYAYGGTAYHAKVNDQNISHKKYRFNGKEKDSETGLYYYGARYYAPWLCRWINCDPAGIEGSGLNMYWFCSGNPISKVDLDGMSDTSFFLRENENKAPTLTLGLHNVPDIPKLKYGHPANVTYNAGVLTHNVIASGWNGAFGFFKNDKTLGDMAYDTVNALDKMTLNDVGAILTSTNTWEDVIAGVITGTLSTKLPKILGKAKAWGKTLKDKAAESFNESFDNLRQGHMGLSIKKIINVDSKILEHASKGDFTKCPKTGKIQKMKGGGHGQENIDFLIENNLKFEIVHEYDNGVRIGNVPDHKTPMKRSGIEQSWFPESWTKKDIEIAGEEIVNLPSNISTPDGKVITGMHKNVKVGIIKTNGKIGTIFPMNIQ